MRWPAPVWLRSFSRRPRFQIEMAQFAGAFENADQFFQSEGLGEVIARANAHGFHGTGDRGEGSHDDD